MWVVLWMSCSMWAPWDSRTGWRHKTKLCTTRVSIPLVTCAQLSLILSFSSGRVRGALLNICPSDKPRESNHTDLKPNVFQSVRVLLQVITGFLLKPCQLLWAHNCQTGRHGSCTDACVDRFEVWAMLSKAIPRFLMLTVAQIPCWKWGHTRMNGPNSAGRANTWLAPASFLACHIPSCATLLHQRLAVVLVFEPALDCDNRICLQKPFHNSSFLLCR
jgi:hypothetical protein